MFVCMRHGFILYETRIDYDQSSYYTKHTKLKKYRDLNYRRNKTVNNMSNQDTTLSQNGIIGSASLLEEQIRLLL